MFIGGLKNWIVNTGRLNQEELVHCVITVSTNKAFILDMLFDKIQVWNHFDMGESL